MKGVGVKPLGYQNARGRAEKEKREVETSNAWAYEHNNNGRGRKDGRRAREKLGRGGEERKNEVAFDQP